MPLTLQILLFALVAAFSPIVLVTTLPVLLSGRGRLNGIAFAVGFLTAQVIVCSVGLAVGAASRSGPVSGKTAILGVVEVVLGVALLGAAWRQHRHHMVHRPPRPRPRLEAMKAKLDLATRLRHLRPGLSLSLGLLFGVGLKRLLITLLAVAHINLASLLAIEEAALIVLYIAVASIPVIVPVGIYVVTGRRAEGWVQVTKAWLTEHQNDLGLYSTAVVGVLLVIGGVTRFF